jgi:hypothetical protein
MMFLQVLQDLFFLLDLPRVVFRFLIGHLDLKLVVFEFLLLSFDLDAEIEELFLKPGLVLLQVSFFRLV